MYGQRSRTVVGEYVCPGVKLHSATFTGDAKIYATPALRGQDYTRLGDIVVKTPVKIIRTDATGDWFQGIGPSRFYYQIASGSGSRPSCSQ